VLIPDVNILIYAHNSRAREYAQARDWWEERNEVAQANGNHNRGCAAIQISSRKSDTQ